MVGFYSEIETDRELPRQAYVRHRAFRYSTTSISMAAETPSLAEQVATLTTQVSNFQNELDAFYLMWAGARVTAALAPPLSHQWRGTWC